MQRVAVGAVDIEYTGGLHGGIEPVVLLFETHAECIARKCCGDFVQAPPFASQCGEVRFVSFYPNQIMGVAIFFILRIQCIDFSELRI